MSALPKQKMLVVPAKKQKNKIPKARPLTTDWSLQSGRVPHLNDPRVDNKVYTFTLNVTLDARYTTSASVPTLSGDAFSLNTFAGYSSKVAVFDQYRIRQLEAWIVPTEPTPSAMMHSVVDYDNATAPGSIAAVQAYSNCHSTTMQNGHYHKWVPHTAAAAYNGAFTGYQNNTKAWIDSAYPNVTMYGLKIGFEITPTAVPVNLVLRAVVDFRNPFG